MRRGEHAPRAFQAPVDVHASADGQVYMFNRRPNESSDDEELNVMEMRPWIFQEQELDRLRNVQLLEREVLDGDSLNKLALQYGCKVKLFDSHCFFAVDLFSGILSVDIYAPPFRFLLTGGRHKAGEQPYAGTRFICTEIY